ncbi:MAG TPA: hypothetical protein VFX03_03370, partial [Thermomicrobiales bacterium]|nr:hypothetical protein [Thermomicrobiales bacterium]
MTRFDGRRAAPRRLAAGVAVTFLALVVLAAPFAASGFAAPPQESNAAASTADGGRGSLRPRGPEAPSTPTPETDRAPKAKRTNNASDRVWPLKANSFTFTQAFGCVHQIANFYASAPGCPPDRPVFHTGIDLSAPLGTT